MGASDYWEMAKLWKSGQIDKRNNFKTHVDMYNLHIRELHKNIWELVR